MAVLSRGVALLCNSCDRESDKGPDRVPTAYSIELMRMLAANAGWRVLGPNDDACPACAEVLSR